MTKHIKYFYVWALLLLVVEFLAFYFAFGALIPALMPRIEARVEAAHEAVLASAAEGETMTRLEELETIAGVSEVYETSGGSYVVRTETQGMEGPLVLLVSVGGDGKVSGIVVGSSAETPNVGGLALKEDYLSRFVGTDTTEGIDVYAGATYTSRSIKDCVEKALLQVRVLSGEKYSGPMELTEEERLAQALTEQMGEGYALTETEAADEMVKAVYTSENGVAVLVEADGHNGRIALLVHLDADGILRKIVPLAQSESPEHGANVFNEAYLYFYEGYSRFSFVDLGDGSKVVDMYSGATETSFRVLQMVQAATAQFAQMNPTDNA